MISRSLLQRVMHVDDEDDIREVTNLALELDRELYGLLL